MVFISYSWDSDEHKQRVYDFVTQLRRDNVQVVYDGDLALGERISKFMENSIADCDYTLFICTPNYKSKADNRLGGAGYENNIITGELYESQNERKFIPVLFSGSWESSLPIWAKGKLGLDLRFNFTYDSEYKKLLHTVIGSNEKNDIVSIDNNPYNHRQISLGSHAKGLYDIDVESINRNVFICGSSGSGKVNTTMFLLTELWKKYSIPCLVITRGGINTIGIEKPLNIDKLTLNPFEFSEGIILIKHIDALLRNFSCLISGQAIYEHLLRKYIIESYKALGWECNTINDGSRKYPTLLALYNNILDATDDNRNYINQLLAIIGNLLNCDYGRIFKGEVSTISVDALAKTPIIINVDKMPIDMYRFFVLTISSYIVEYIKAKPCNYSLEHVVCIESLFINSVMSSEKSLEQVSLYFAEIMAELRTYGEGVIIVEQTPCIPDDIIRSVDTKIIHRLILQKDHERLFSILPLSLEQRSLLGKLGVGEALISRNFSSTPCLVSIFLCATY